MNMQINGRAWHSKRCFILPPLFTRFCVRHCLRIASHRLTVLPSFMLHFGNLIACWSWFCIRLRLRFGLFLSLCDLALALAGPLLHNAACRYSILIIYIYTYMYVYVCRSHCIALGLHCTRIYWYTYWTKLEHSVHCDSIWWRICSDQSCLHAAHTVASITVGFVRYAGPRMRPPLPPSLQSVSQTDKHG